MTYSNKQIKRILRIQDFVELSNTLSKIYVEFDDKELSIDTMTERNRVYKVYCSSIYNLLNSIKNSKDLFGKCKRFNDFELFINKEFYATDKKYYNQPNYKSNFYKIIKYIRDQVNHFFKDDEDDTMLFEMFIDFKIIEKLRIIINDIFYEVYNKISKKRIESIILSKPRIQYSFDKINEKINYIEQKYNESTNEIDKMFSRENEESIHILKEYFDSNNLISFFNKDEDTIKKYDLMDNKLNSLNDNFCKYIEENGTDQQKEAIRIINNCIHKEVKSKKEYEIKIENLKNDLIKIVDKYDTNK